MKKQSILNKEDRAYGKCLIEIHFAVFLFGLSSLFAKFVAQPAPIIAWGRVVFSSLSLFFLHKKKRWDMKLERKAHYYALWATGIVLAIHWSTFFLSAQISTIAIATLTFSTFPVFVTFLEPYFFKEKLCIRDVILAIIMLLGVCYMVPEFKLGNLMTSGVILGMICSFTYAVMSLVNRKFAGFYQGSVVSFHEQLAAAVVMTPFVFIYKPVISFKDVFFLMLLGIVFTALAHSLFTGGMKHVKARTAGIISGLEAVYGIVFAAILLSEIPSIREVVGAVLILGVVFYSTLKAKIEKN